MNNKETGIQQKLRGMGQSWSKAKPTKTVAFWIAIGAILFVLYLGFSRAGWVTDGTALQRAGRTADDAVVARLAPICVAQFNQDPEREQKLEEFKELNTPNQRAAFVRENGWATMPGETAPDTKVALECGSQIAALNE